LNVLNHLLWELPNKTKTRTKTSKKAWVLWLREFQRAKLFNL
jgi:hypothetical protein